MQVALLGPLEVSSDQERVVLGAPKERAVLEMLALRAGRPVPAGALCEGLWGEAPPVSAGKTIQTYVSHLRRALSPESVVTTSGGYLLQVGGGSVDAASFERATQEAKQKHDANDLPSAASVLQEALALWRGRPCPELTEHSWATAEVARLEELRRDVEEDLVDLRLATGEGARLVGELESAVDAEPLRERRWAQLMLALYRAGRQADALRAFARLRKRLAEELGIEPSPELVALEQSVLLQSSELDYHAPDGAEEGKVMRPPLRRAGPLPVPTSTFIGRTEEVAEAEKLVGESRLVTLAGSGGCGKTRLALEVAARASSRYVGGVFFAPLAPVTDGDLVIAAVAEAMGVQSQSQRALADVIAEVVGRRETLVVFDNCEHVVGAAATLAEHLLEGAPGLRLLATSRDPLRIAGETVWRVPSLPVPTAGATADDCRASPAVQLFVDRALAAHPGLCLDDETVPTIAEVTRRLDGMPLAIELAAARVGVLDLMSILEGLSDRFALLTGGSRTAPARQQTLRAAVAWSYDLLGATEKDLFRRLSVFPASFGLDAAVAVSMREPAEATEDLFALVSKSMVGTAPSGGGRARYAVLETLRQFGAGQLDEPTAEQARAEHADYYLSVVHSAGPEPFGPSVGPWIKRIDLEFDNLRAVFSYLMARPGRHNDVLRALAGLRRYWVIRSRNLEGLELLDRAIADRGSDEDPVLRARVLATAAQLAGDGLDANVGARYAKAASELAEEAGDARTAAYAVAVLADLHGMAGRHDDAEGERALDLARQVGDPHLVCDGLMAYAFSIPLDDVVRSRAAWEELLATAEAGGDAGFCAVAHANLCLFGFIDNDAQTARPHVELAIKLAQELGSSFSDNRLAELLHVEGNYSGALAASPSAFEWARRRDKAVWMADVASNAAGCLSALKSDDETAARLYGFAGHELTSAGFGQRYEGDALFDADMDALKARLGSRLTPLLEEGAVMSREEVAELLIVLGKTASSTLRP